MHHHPCAPSHLGRLLGLVLLTALAGPPARATTDAGRSTRLLAVAGAATRYAVVVEEDVQAACGGAPCQVYLVRLGARPPARQHVLNVGATADHSEHGPAALKERLLKSLPRRLSLDLARTWQGVESLHAAGKSVADDTFALPSLGALRATLKAVGAPATKGAGRAGAASGSCWHADCLRCTQVTRTIRGKRRPVERCTRRRGPIKVEGEPQPCSCDARPQLYLLDLALVAKPGSRAKLTAIQARIAADPTTFGQNVLGGCRGASCTALSLDLKVYLTPQRELVVLGAAVHARPANGTYLPVFLTGRLSRPQGR